MEKVYKLYKKIGGAANEKNALDIKRSANKGENGEEIVEKLEKDIKKVD